MHRHINKGRISVNATISGYANISLICVTRDLFFAFTMARSTINPSSIQPKFHLFSALPYINCKLLNWIYLEQHCCLLFNMCFVLGSFILKKEKKTSEWHSVIVVLSVDFLNLYCLTPRKSK